MEPKSCPFCGGKASVMISRLFARTVYKVSCENDNCEVNACTWNYSTREEAIKVWNQRAAEARQMASK